MVQPDAAILRTFGQAGIKRLAVDTRYEPAEWAALERDERAGRAPLRIRARAARAIPSRVSSRFSGLIPGDAERVLHRQLPLSSQPVAQRLALDVGHGEPQLAGALARIEHGEDVGP
jgi:hypothetical protein